MYYSRSHYDEQPLIIPPQWRSSDLQIRRRAANNKGVSRGIAYVGADGRDMSRDHNRPRGRPKNVTTSLRPGWISREMVFGSASASDCRADVINGNGNGARNGKANTVAEEMAHANTRPRAPTTSTRSLLLLLTYACDMHVLLHKSQFRASRCAPVRVTCAGARARWSLLGKQTGARVRACKRSAATHGVITMKGRLITSRRDRQDSESHRDMYEYSHDLQIFAYARPCINALNTAIVAGATGTNTIASHCVVYN